MGGESYASGSCSMEEGNAGGLKWQPSLGRSFTWKKLYLSSPNSLYVGLPDLGVPPGVKGKHEHIHG